MSRLRSQDELKNFAKTAASMYVEGEKPLNDTLTKIAQEESLVPDQLRYVVQEANKESWARLFRMNKEAAYEFPVADADKILSNLQDNYSPTVVKDIDLDYIQPPQIQKEAQMDAFKAFGIEKTAGISKRNRREVVRDLHGKLEKCAYAKNEYYMQNMEQNTFAENTQKSIVTDLKNELLTHKFSNRPKEFGKFAAAALTFRNDDRMKNRVMGIKEILEDQQVMEKKAALEAPEEYINRDMAATIINGNSEMVIRLKTLMEYDDKAADAFARHAIVSDAIPKIKEAIREL